MSARAVLFDMDGTLVDSEPLHYETLLEAIAAFSGTVPDDFENRVTGTTIADCHAMLRTETGFAADLDAFVKAKYAAYVSGAIKLKLRPGAAQVLSFLDKSGIPYAIVSNSDRMLVDANLRAVGLQRPDFFSVSRNDVRKGKPDAEPYLRGAYLLGVEPSHCIVVEDSVPGARAGLAAGMTVIGWPEPHRTDLTFPDGVVIADPENLLSSLQPLLSAVAQ
ncbi:HAD family phosphatase [Brucella sp. HL-2]|nr:HAD family phosphatase [Brucella sp. HL-2]MCV9907894.1 HAD family phosphatase [Brucella sp. HL-2]